jgi:Cyclic nucleotide-binding domain
MALFGAERPTDVGELIARRRFAEAISALRKRLETERYNAALRMQLADVLVLAGRAAEAVPVYLHLADDFAADGFAARAIALLKKAQKINPGRSDVEGRLASFLKGGDKPAAAGPDHDPGPGAVPSGHSAFVYEPSALDMERAPAAEEPLPERHGDRRSEPRFGLPMVFDPTPLPVAEEDNAAADYLRGELLDTIQDVLREPIPVRKEPARVQSPLFKDLEEDELQAVIRGLKLLTFEAGDIILHQGDDGGSLFLITTGRVKVFIKEPGGRRHVLVRTMAEGDFFGEVSLLKNEPRTATVIAAADCELLELDRPTLEELCQKHPRVRQVLEDFAQERLLTQKEALSRNTRTGRERA